MVIIQMHITVLQCFDTFESLLSYVHLLSQDDNHNIKVGEPSFPVAAVDRGKQVLVCTPSL